MYNVNFKEINERFLLRQFPMVQRQRGRPNMVQTDSSHGSTLPYRILALYGGNGTRIHKSCRTNI